MKLLALLPMLFMAAAPSAWSISINADNAYHPWLAQAFLADGAVYTATSKALAARDIRTGRVIWVHEGYGAPAAISGHAILASSRGGLAVLSKKGEVQFVRAYCARDELQIPVAVAADDTTGAVVCKHAEWLRRMSVTFFSIATGEVLGRKDMSLVTQTMLPRVVYMESHQAIVSWAASGSEQLDFVNKEVKLTPAPENSIVLKAWLDRSEYCGTSYQTVSVWRAYRMVSCGGGQGGSLVVSIFRRP